MPGLTYTLASQSEVSSPSVNLFWGFWTEVMGLRSWATGGRSPARVYTIGIASDSPPGPRGILNPSVDTLAFLWYNKEKKSELN